MGFLGIGTWEVLLILILAVIILGPGKLPEIARTLGRTVRAIRKASAELTTAVTRELEATKTETPSQLKGGGNSKPVETPSATGEARERSRDDQPQKTGGASTAK